ncbi:hypothetical protein V1525DRAFT_393668 [Lipomyces kononenkoae]|uniref:Uncharacterized protein n=1 Tax=Lipomyces kononenkoae TaxID=34357 RepID=A0ACC3TBE2_LIPKO
MSFLLEPLSIPGLEDTLAFGFPLADLIPRHFNNTATLTATTSDNKPIPVSHCKSLNATRTGNWSSLATWAVKTVANFLVRPRNAAVPRAAVDISNRPDPVKSSALSVYSPFWDIVKSQPRNSSFTHLTTSLSLFHRSRHMHYGMPSPYLYSRLRLLSCLYGIGFAAGTLAICSNNPLLPCLDLPDVHIQSSRRLHIIGDSYNYVSGDKNCGTHLSTANNALLKTNLYSDVIVFFPRSNPWLLPDNRPLIGPTGINWVKRRHHLFNTLVQLNLDQTKNTPNNRAIRMNSSSTPSRHIIYFSQAYTDFGCLSGLRTHLGRAKFLPLDLNRTQASPSPTSTSKLSEYMQHVKMAGTVLDSVTPSSDTDVDSIFDDDGTVTDNSPLDTPTCEADLVDYFGGENEANHCHRRGSRIANHASKMKTKNTPEITLAITDVDQTANSPHLLQTQTFPTKRPNKVGVISTDMKETTNVQDADGNSPAHPESLPRRQRGKYIAPKDEEIPEGLSLSQIYSEMGGFMFQHLDTTPGLRLLFSTRDHRKGSKHIKEEVKIMYDTITRHRALGYDEQSIADLAVHEVYAWRDDHMMAK